MNVPVIEDDRKIASLLERGLSEHGHRVSVSGNGRQGVEMMVGGEYDAALLDISTRDGWSRSIGAGAG